MYAEVGATASVRDEAYFRESCARVIAGTNRGLRVLRCGQRAAEPLDLALGVHQHRADSAAQQHYEAANRNRC